MIKARRISALLLCRTAARLHSAGAGRKRTDSQLRTHPHRRPPASILSRTNFLKADSNRRENRRAKIQAVYDWIIRNCVRDGWDGTTWFDEAQVSAAADALARDPNYQAQILRPEFKAERTPGDLPGMYLYDYDSNAYIAAFAYEMMYKRCELRTLRRAPDRPADAAGL